MTTQRPISAMISAIRTLRPARRIPASPATRAPFVALSVAALFACLVASSSGCSSGATADPAPERTPVRSEATPQTSARGDGGAPAATSQPPPAGPDTSPSARRQTYRNPVLARDFPDPFVLRSGDAYYAFATNADEKNVQAATSTDLVHWDELPDALPVLPAWATAGVSLTWAPSVLQRGDVFIMYYTAHVDALGFQCISRAIASRPEGPYVDASTAPLICQTSGAEALCGSIDPSPIVDASGTPYLVWKSDENAPACNAPSHIWAQRLSDDGFALVGSRTAILARTEGWEYPVIEGPSMVFDGDRYYLFYSANTYESDSYAVGYAVCDSVTGPCVKKTLDRADGSPAALVHSAGPALGPGGQELFRDAHGKLWMAYHAWTSPRPNYSTGGARSLRIDPLTFANGAPVFSGPTTDTQLL